LRGHAGILLVCAALIPSCSAPPRPEALYEQAVASLRSGNASGALKLAREAAARCSPRTACRWSARLLEAEILWLERELDSADAILAEEIPEAPPFTALAARRSMLQGGLHLARRRLDDAERLYERAERIAVSAGASDVALDTGTQRAQLLFMRRRAEDADALFHKVAERAAAERQPYYEAIALNGLGMMRLMRSRFDEAIPWFERTVEAARRADAQRLVVAASHNLAICYSHLGSFDEALEVRKRAFDLLGESGLASYRMNLLGEMGTTYWYEGDARKAVPLYQQALMMAKTEADAALWRRNLAGALVALRDWDAAERHNREALVRVKDAEAQALPKQTAAAIAAGRERYEEAAALYQEAIAAAGDNPVVLWESSAGLAKVHARAGNYALANREFARSLTLMDRHLAALSSDSYRLTFFSLLIDFYRNYVQMLLDQKQFEKALEIADASRARILSQRLAMKSAPEPKQPGDYRRIARASKSVVLYYWVAPERSYLWVITPERVHRPFELPESARIQNWVERYRQFTIDRLGDPIQVRNEAGHQLYTSLIAAAGPLVSRGSRVIIVPDGALHWLNFETLPVYDDAPGAKTRYWAEDVQVAVAPSLGVLGEQPAPANARGKSILILGDPVPPGSDFPKLDYASDEIARIRTRFPAEQTEVVTGAQAHPDAYPQVQPGRFSLLHFSAHSVANQQSPLESAIILSPHGDKFKLYARDIIGVPLRADLVTLSACRSAGARSYSGEGLVGFTWAFLQAGARRVIAGLWDVTDRSTPDIMEVLYSRMQSGEEPATALREAKLALIRSGRNFRKPYYWGPFQLYVRQL
jgi:CHAT domain-containing protein